MVDLNILVAETGADSGLIFSIDGILIESYNLEYDGNVADDRNDIENEFGAV